MTPEIPADAERQWKQLEHQLHTETLDELRSARNGLQRIAVENRTIAAKASLLATNAEIWVAAVDAELAARSGSTKVE